MRNVNLAHCVASERGHYECTHVACVKLLRGFREVVIDFEIFEPESHEGGERASGVRSVPVARKSLKAAIFLFEGSFSSSLNAHGRLHLSGDTVSGANFTRFPKRQARGPMPRGLQS